ncbi:MAG: RDD family protein [Candidatus Limnocylindrales bacterium]
MSWQAPAPAAEPQPGPAGFVYADLPNRIIAYVIDIVILFVINIVVTAVVGAVGLNISTFSLANGFTYNYLAVVVIGLIGLAVSAGYFIYTWTRMRGTIGMRALGMQIGNEGNGATLTQNQAIKRWIYVGGWISIVQIVNPVPLLGILVGLAGLIYIIYLLYTTAQSPTKQGYHDHAAKTMVVKATRSVA